MKSPGSSVLGMGLSAALLVLLTGGAGAQPEKEGKPFAVEGVVFPEKEVSLSSPLQDKIVEFSIEEGDKVKAGQVIARLDYKRKELLVELAKATYEADAEIKLAKANLGYRKREFERAKSLYDLENPDKSVISEERFDKVSNEYAVA